MNISQKHQNLKFKAQRFRSSLCDIANAIIDSSSNMNEVEDMLVDKNYSGIQVIDMIAFLDVIEILQNPMLDSIISNMYYGPYQREVFLKKSTCYKTIEEMTNNSPGTDSIVTKTFKFFGYNHSFKILQKYFKTKTKVFKRCKIFNSKHICIIIIDDEVVAGGGVDDAEENIGHAFQFNVWKKALDVKYNFDLICILIFSFVMLLYANNLVDDEISLTIRNTSLSNLYSMPSSDDINIQINDILAQMRELNDQYFSNLYLLMTLSVLSIAYLINNIQEIIYSSLRGVFVEVLSAEFILNLSNSILVIYWVLCHFLIFMSGLSNYQLEFQALTLISRMNDAIYFNLKICNAANIALQFSRLVFSLQVIIKNKYEAI